MKKNIFCFLYATLLACSLAAQTPGFTSVTAINPVTVSTYTTRNPQAKIWTYAGKWWTVLATSAGTKIFRLDGTTWTDVLTISGGSVNSKADCWVSGNVTHILLFRDATRNSYLVSVEYDPTTNSYQLWSQRPTNVTLVFEAGSQTATLTLDGNGRMWVAAAGTSNVKVQWSDAPFTIWSSPIIIASGINNDICAITALTGKIGVLWSNQNTKRFGFKYHTDGADPTEWSADEVPASQSALDIKSGMADDHFNMTVASDGTLYCAVETRYDSAGYTQIGLLVRRPSGTWDNLYTVTLAEGYNPFVILNEVLGKLKVFYSSELNGGNILYRESPTSNISFGTPITAISNGSNQYNYVTSTHQTYDSEVVILATNMSTNPFQATAILGSETADDIAPLVESVNRQVPETQTTTASSLTWRVTFSEPVTGVDVADFDLTVISESVSGSFAPGAVAPVGSTGTTYDVTLSGVSGNGEIRMNVAAGGIQDLAGNTLGLPFSNGQTYIINQNAPSSIQVFPNPLTTITKVSFTIPFSGWYYITLFDTKGAKIMVLRQGWAEAGIINTINVNGSGLKNGLYFIKLQSGKVTQVRKLIVNK